MFTFSIGLMCIYNIFIFIDNINFFSGTTSPNPFDMSGLSSNLTSGVSASNTGTKPKKSVQSLLGEHSNLVNLDNLVTDKKTQQGKFL